MGGFGSGNFRPHKTPVEACLHLDMTQWTQCTVLRPGIHIEGTGYVPHPAIGEPCAAMTWTLHITAPREGRGSGQSRRTRTPLSRSPTILLSPRPPSSMAGCAGGCAVHWPSTGTLSTVRAPTLPAAGETILWLSVLLQPHLREPPGPVRAVDARSASHHRRGRNRSAKPSDGPAERTLQHGICSPSA